MSGFSLRALVFEVVAESSSEDRQQIIKEIEARVPKNMLAEALSQALPAYVHSVVPRWPNARTGVLPARKGSAKVAAIREAWRQHLENRYTVRDGSWRPLGDLGADDLTFIAKRLDGSARSHLERAKDMRALAAALAEHGAAKVRDLPPGFLASFFGEAAE
jgi:hypothetical protein